MNKPQAMSSLRHAFPELDALGDSAALCTDVQDAHIDVYDFACFVVDLQEHNETGRVRAAFFLIENFLVHGSPELRDWVDAEIEALQNVCAWRRQSALSPALGSKTRVLWDLLESIRRASSELDLSDCSVLEAEILTWRLIREKVRALSAAA